MDFMTPVQRSLVMSRIRSTETKAEVRLRKALFAQGYRYRKNVRGMPGTPDIVLPKFRYVIQVRGCFWHAHQGCPRAHQPATNVGYWLPKLAKNQKRDREADRALRVLGWRVCVVWECELSSPKGFERIARKICADIRQHYRRRRRFT